MKKEFLYIPLLALSMSACQEGGDADYQQADSGLLYRFYNKHEDALKPEIGGAVYVRFEMKNDQDSLIISSDYFNQQGAQAAQFPIQEILYPGDMNELFLMMAEGDSASFKLSADSFYLKTLQQKKLPDFIDPGTLLTFDVKLEKVRAKEDVERESAKYMEYLKELEAMKVEEQSKIETYVKENSIAAQATENGLYYISTKKGSGAQIQNGQIATVHYTGKFFDGKVFDSSEGRDPIKFRLGQDAVIQGWHEGIAKMKVGEKATLIIPSSLGYGEMGSRGVIPPYSPLLFDVELLNAE